MKSTLRNIFTVILVLAASICLALGLAACQPEAKVTELIIENAKVDFVVGDEFTLGDDCVIYAVYDDGTRVDVTAEAELRKEAGFDMNVSDEYQITVSFGGKKEVYSIYVSDFNNVLKKIELDTSGVKKQYALGDVVSFDGLIIAATYENAQGRLVVFHYTSLKNFNVEIKAQDGTVTEEAFMKLGNYTITVSQGNVRASYAVTVNGIGISSVQSAINIGKIFSSEVASGTQSVESSLHGGEYFDDTDYEYKYGDNYTYVKDTRVEETFVPGEDEGDEGTMVKQTIVNEYHYSILDGEIFCARFENGKLATTSQLLDEMMNGPVNLLWYSFLSVYGIENTLSELYKAAKVCTNGDLVETVDEANRAYSFTFSGLVNHTSRPDYYETTVSFTLGEKYNIKSAEYTQKYWENNESASGAEWYVPSFITDENGKTVPNIVYSKATHVVIRQQTGERTAQNPYSKSLFTVTSFDLSYNGVTLDGPDGTIQCNMSNPNIQIKIQNILPVTADLTVDRMLFSYEGNRGGYQDSVGVPVGPSRGFLAYRSGVTADVINVTLKGGGTWKLLIKTAEVEKSVTFVVTGEAPTVVEPFIRNEASGNFYAGNSKTITVNGEIYFYGNISMGLDASQTATVTSANASTATVERTKAGDISCFKFTASVAGTYTVRVVSDSNQTAYCDFTFTVAEEPDYAALLNGKYTVTTGEEIYEVTFTQSSTDPVTGTVLVVKTPTNSSGEPDTANAKSQTFDFSVNRSNMEIVLVGDIGNTLGIDLSVNAAGNLILNDVHDNNYVLQRVN